jgi:hypothetical protein
MCSQKPAIRLYPNEVKRSPHNFSMIHFTVRPYTLRCTTWAFPLEVFSSNLCTNFSSPAIYANNTKDEVLYCVIFSPLSLFWKNESRLMRSPCCLCVCESRTINLRMPQPIFIKLGMYIMAPEPISTVCFINPSHQSVCLYVYPPFVAKQRLDKTLPRQRIHTQQ